MLDLAVGHAGGDHQTRGEVALGPAEVHHQCIGDDVDQWMFADPSNGLPQECLDILPLKGGVDIPQISPQLGLLFNQIDLEPLFGQLEGGSHPPYPAANDQSLLDDPQGLLGQGFDE